MTVRSSAVVLPLHSGRLSRAVARAAGYAKWYNATGADMAGNPHGLARALDRRGRHKQAERSYRATEERLQQELQDTEQRLTELQAAKGEGDLLVISDDEQAEIQRFMDRRLEIRRELRQVQHDLRRDIDRLDTRIKVINIVLVPALVMLIALIWAVRRRRRQARANAAREVTP